jgi:hypothetical protein
MKTACCDGNDMNVIKIRGFFAAPALGLAKVMVC